MENSKFSLCVVAGRDGMHHTGLCLSAGSEFWYLFQDSSGICFRTIKDGLTTTYTVAEIKQKKPGIYRAMSHKWNQISSILKGSGDL